MSWTDERIDTLKTMWEKGLTANQIAVALGGVSRNAVIGKAHRLGLQSRPSPVKPNEVEAKPAAPKPAIAATEPTEPAPKPAPAPRQAQPTPVAATPAPPAEVEPEELEPVEKAPAVIMRSVGPGGFLRQAPGEQQAPITPAPPRRLVPAKPSADMVGKTTLLDLNDRICKWPLGHPGEPDFHFCGEKVNPGFPYCVAHCSHAYQAQLPRRDRRPPPPLPFGGPRVR